MGRVGEGNVKVGGLLPYKGACSSPHIYTMTLPGPDDVPFRLGNGLEVKADARGPFRVGKLGAGLFRGTSRRSPRSGALPWWARPERQLLPQCHQPHLLRSGCLRH